MTRAAVYLRISEDPTGEAAGVTRQREDCLALVEAQGWEIHEIYEDNDISASSGRVRPRYKAMLVDISLGHIDAVVAWHPDRLYRKLADLEGLIEAIDKHNVIMRTHRAGEIDLSTPTGRMLARILSATAQAEGEIKADRWLRSWRQGREAGKVVRTGSRMFGYDQDGAIVGHEAVIAREMASRILDGDTILGTARWLDDLGIKATRGSAWTPQSIKRYLTNPRLAGWSTLNGDIVAEGQWEPIVDRDTWEGVRAILTAETRAYVPRKALLNKLIYCGKCDHFMVTSKAKDKRTYRCPKRPGLDGCGGVSGNAEPIEEIVEAYARRRLNDPRVRQRIATLRAEPSGAQAEVSALELRITELEGQLDEPGTPVATILRAVDRAKERQGELLRTIAARSGVPLPVNDLDWPDDLRRRRALVDLVVAKVVLNPGTGRHPRFGFDVERVEITPADAL